MPVHIKSILDLDDDVMSLVLRKLQMIRLHTQLKEYLHTHKISEGETCGIIKYAAPWQQPRCLARYGGVETGHARVVAVSPKCTNVSLYYVGRSVPTPGARLCG